MPKLNSKFICVNETTCLSLMPSLTLLPCSPKIIPTKPSHKKPNQISMPLSLELGEFVIYHAKAIKEQRWEAFLKQYRKRGDLGHLKLNYPAISMLQNYKFKEVPVKLSTLSWSKQKLQQAILCVTYPSCNHNLKFLETEFIDMINQS